MDVTELRKRALAWRAADPDAQTRAEVDALLAELDGGGAPGARAELADRFGLALEFGTAGLRGVLGAGPNRMNRAVVRRTTAGLARYLKAQAPEAARRGVVVGRDGRRMSAEFAEDVAGVLAAEGVPALVFPGLAPTPLVAFALGRLGAGGAVVVTASHNPPEYNGYKVYWGNGAQIVPPHDAGIAAAIDAVEGADRVPLLSPAEARARGLWRDLPDSVGEEYLEALLSLRLHREDAGRVRVVYTAMHGVGGPWALAALARAGFTRVTPVAEQQAPDGAFPTVRFPNPEEPGAMDLALALAERERADLVLANDPDADRLAVVARAADGVLRTFTGNEVGVLLGHYLLTRGPQGPGPRAVLTTVVSSAQLGDIARAVGAHCEEVLTGFKWIANRALALEAETGARLVLGYEEALGYTVGTAVRDKDGIGAALVFADLAAWCAGRGQTVPGYLEEVQRAHGLYVSAQTSVTLKGAEGLSAMKAIMDGFRARPPAAIGGMRVGEVRDYLPGGRLPPSNVLAFLLDGGARVTLRPSGTEPKIKYYFELRENLQPGENPTLAHTRAQGRLTALQSAFMALAKERGQP